MKKIGVSLFLAATLLTATGTARTVDQLKTEFKNVLPAGSKARMVWPQGESVNGSMVGILWVIDSDSGVARKLSTTVSMNAWSPHLTSDGSRVVYFDSDRGETVVLGWDGAGPRKLVIAGWQVKDYWRDPAATMNPDWAVVTDGNSVKRINIDTKAEVALSTPGISAEVGDNISLSRDGTHLGGFFQLGGGYAAGVVDVKTGAKTLETNTTGCVASIAPDNSYSWMRQLSGHKAVLLSTSPTASKTVNVTDSIISWANKNGSTASCATNDAQFEQTRWTNHIDYITFEMDNIKANPYLYCFSTKKWLYIQENQPCGGTECNAIIFTATGIGIDYQKAKRIFNVKYSRYASRFEDYSLDGRSIGREAIQSHVPGMRGVIVRRVIDGEGTGYILQKLIVRQ